MRDNPADTEGHATTTIFNYKNNHIKKKVNNRIYPFLLAVFYITHLNIFLRFCH
jgi:hypothetical protein